MTTAIIDRVRAGTIYLDKTMPGWRDQVAINELDLADTCRCVLGQIFEPQARRAGAVSEEGFNTGRGMGYWFLVKPVIATWGSAPVLDSQILTSEDAIELGFDVTDEGNEVYGELTHLWRQVIKGVPADELEAL